MELELDPAVLVGEDLLTLRPRHGRRLWAANNGLRRHPRGAVRLVLADGGEFQDEGNNITAAALPVALALPPDLQVTSLIVPQRTPRGQEFSLTYTVSNLGGATPSTQESWYDLIYLSRDEFLDLRAGGWFARWQTIDVGSMR